MVTGANRGIGAATAIKLAEYGASVLLTGRDKASLNEVANTIYAAGGTVETFVCDVSQFADVQNAVNYCIKTFGSLDVLVNNAGTIDPIVKLSESDPEVWGNAIDVNVKGVYNCIHSVIPHMKISGGVILNMASIASTVGINDRFAYSMSKGAVLTMTYSVAKDYIDFGIRCNSISPGRVHTPFVDGFIAKNYPGKEKETFEKLSKTQPIGRMGKPEEIGNLAAYLCSDEAAFITGTDFPIDGGFIKLNG